jgi:hypothetical protein
MTRNDLKRMLVGADGELTPAAEAGPAAVHHHYVVVAGRVAGVWEHGADGQLRYATFTSVPADVREILFNRAEAMATFIRRDLGEARFHAGSRGRVPTLGLVLPEWQGAAVGTATGP